MIEGSSGGFTSELSDAGRPAWLGCGNVWSGSSRTAGLLALPGLDAWVHSAPAGTSEVGVVRGELAVNGQAAQRRRADMEYASQDEVRILALRHQREIRFLP